MNDKERMKINSDWWSIRVVVTMMIWFGVRALDALPNLFQVGLEGILIVLIMGMGYNVGRNNPITNDWL